MWVSAMIFLSIFTWFLKPIKCQVSGDTISWVSSTIHKVFSVLLSNLFPHVRDCCITIVIVSTYICSTWQKFKSKLCYKHCHNICSCWNKYSVPLIPLGTYTVIFIPVEIIFQNNFSHWNLHYEGTSILWQ